MNEKVKMPVWVWLAYSSITTRKGAKMLILASVIFTVYALPWSALFPGQDWLATVFLIEDWSWFAMMVPITFWYWISLKWMDNHSRWEVVGEDKS